MNFHNIFSHNEKNIVKFSIIVGLIALVLVEFIAYLSPQQGYEISFYDSSPSIIFILIGVAIVGGTYILFQQVVSGNYRRSKLWIGGFLLLLLTRMITLYLPYIRGYYTWMGDNSTHLGLVREAFLKGHVDPNNFYPITHIFLTQIVLVTSLPVEFIVNHSTAAFSILYVLAVYLLAKIAFDDDKPIILTMAAVTAVIFSGYEVYLMPNGWSCLYLPLAVYLIIQSMKSKQNVSFQILALIAIVLFPFFHPFSTLLLILILLIFVVIIVVSNNIPAFQRFVPARLRQLRVSASSRFNNMPIFLMGIGITIWMLWLLSFHFFNANIRNLVDSVLSSETVDVVGAMAETAGKMDFNLMDILLLLIKDYGHELIFIATFLMGIVIFVRNRRRFAHAEILFLLAIVPITFGLFFMVYLSGMVPGLDSINAVRVQSFIFLVVPIFTGIFFSFALSRKRSSVACLCFLLLLLPALLAVFSAFPSPYVNRPTPDVTEMDLGGMDWSFQYKDVELPYVYIMSPPYRFADIIMGRTEREQRSDIDRVAIKIPDHFNYSENRYFGDEYANNSYAVITEFDTILYDTAYERVGRFHAEDFDHLQADPTVDRVYCNKECTVYIVRGTG